MPVTIRETDSGRGRIVECTGAVTGNELVDINDQILHDTERLKGLLFCIVDHTLATSTDYSTSELANIAAQDHLIAQHVVPGFLIAIVAPKASTLSLSRMWESLARATGWETMLVNTYSEAEAWVKNRARARFGIEANL
jgi:hypothetical protein